MSNFIDSFWFWLLKVLALFLLLIFLLWLILRPSSPSYNITDFSLNTTSTPSSVSFTLEFSNNNKGGSVHYKHINVSVYNSNDSFIGVTTLSDIDQGHEKSTDVKGSVEVKTTEAMEGKEEERYLRVGMVAKVRYKIWWWKSKVHGVDVGAGVRVGKDGKVSGKNKTIEMKKVEKWRKAMSRNHGSHVYMNV